MTLPSLAQAKLCFKPFLHTKLTTKRHTTSFLALCFILTGCVSTDSANEITSYVYQSNNHNPLASVSMFPTPVTGMSQHVLQLPKRENESHYEVEVQLGKTMLADCNLKGYWGDLAIRNLQGWGYSYYELTEYSKGMSTMMMCNEPKTNKFIPIGDAFKFKYYSRLPKVFYLPADVELTYRTWKVAQDYQTSK